MLTVLRDRWVDRITCNVGKAKERAVVKVTLDECQIYAQNTSQVRVNLSGVFYEGRPQRKTLQGNIPPQFFLLGASHANSGLNVQVWYDVQTGEMGETAGASEWHGKKLLRAALQANVPQMTLHHHLMGQLYGGSLSQRNLCTVRQEAAQASWSIMQCLQLCVAARLVGDMDVVVQRYQAHQKRLAALAFQQQILQRQLLQADVRHVAVYVRGRNGMEEYAFEDDGGIRANAKLSLALRGFCREHLLIHRRGWSQGDGGRWLFRFDLKMGEPENAYVMTHHFARPHEEALLSSAVTQQMSELFGVDHAGQERAPGVLISRGRAHPKTNSSSTVA